MVSRCRRALVNGLSGAGLFGAIYAIALVLAPAAQAVPGGLPSYGSFHGWGTTVFSVNRDGHVASVAGTNRPSGRHLRAKAS